METCFHLLTVPGHAGLHTTRTRYSSGHVLNFTGRARCGECAPASPAIPAVAPNWLPPDDRTVLRVKMQVAGFRRGTCSRPALFVAEQDVGIPDLFDEHERRRAPRMIGSAISAEDGLKHRRRRGGEFATGWLEHMFLLSGRDADRGWVEGIREHRERAPGVARNWRR